jgi:TonB family protein
MVGGHALNRKNLLTAPLPPRRPLLPLAASVAAHSVAILLLFEMRMTPQIVASPARLHAVLLMAPAAAAVRPIPRRPPSGLRPRDPLPHLEAHVDRLPPRLFRQPAAAESPSARRIAIQPLPAPLLETPPAPVALPPTQRAAALSPPPLKTDNLAATLVRPPAPAASAAIQDGGFSNATAAAPVVQRSAPAVTGSFGASAAESVRRPPAPVARAGFGDATVAAAPAPPADGPQGAAALTKPVEIISKPRPSYSDEARRLQIEGEVLVEMLFAASGETRVIRLVRGLGHGLDENALAAAQAIRFRPAQRAGTAVDSAVIVHIVFQLAY